MNNLVKDIDSSICSINSCLADYASGFVKSNTFGRDKKANLQKDYVTALNHIKDRLERYKGRILTNECYPATCDFDSCLQGLQIYCDDVVPNDNFLVYGSTQLEKYFQSYYNIDRGTTISMSIADDDGVSPATYTRVKFYEWDNCENTNTAISDYINIPDADVKNYIYVPETKQYLICGDEWIVKLDENFTVLDSQVYGGSRSWRSFDYDFVRNEIYLVDNTNESLDIVRLSDLTLQSTTVLDQAATAVKKPRQCIYFNGLVFISGFEKFWTLDPDTLVNTLRKDETATGIKRGAFVIYPDDRLGVVVVDSTDGVNSLEKWGVSSGFPFVSSTHDLDLQEEAEIGGEASLTKLIDTDLCGNTYFLSGSRLKDADNSNIVVAIYNKNFVKQDVYTSYNGWLPAETGVSGRFNPSSNKIYFWARYENKSMIILDVKKSDGNKVDLFPEQCNSYSEEEICNLITTASKLCSKVCK